MIIESLKMVNFRCHRNKTIEFNSGVTAITGSNGAGKSTIFEAIVFGMTGALDEKGKSNAISVGEVSGHVTVQFKIGSKQGTVTRCLHSSEVRLVFDGKEYRKATDVKELLESLLQINPDIFQRVIVARQGEIPLLFSGDSSVRTAIFQKIFMVPNTNNLRDVLWNDYIKKLPVPLPVEDIELLKQEKSVATSLLEKLSVEYTPTKHLVKELNLLQQDLNLKEKELFNAQTLKSVDEKINSVNQKIDTIKTELEGFDFKVCETEIDNLKLKKLNIAKTLRVLDKYEFNSVAELQNKITEIKKEIEYFTEELNRLSAQREPIAQKFGQLEVISNLEIGSCCPVCSSEIQHPEQLRKACKTEQELLERQLKSIDDLFYGIRHKCNRLTQLPMLKENIDTLEIDLTFDEQAYEKCVLRFKRLNNLSIALTNDEMQLQELEEQKIKLKTTRNSDLINNDISKLTSEIPLKQKEIDNNAELESKVIEQQQIIKNLSDRMNTSTINKRKNDSTNELRETLLVMHDLFNPAIFAKRVIQKFTNIVTEYLAANTKQFNLSYTVAVNEEFNIDVYDQKDRLIPKVSGGQEIIIGLCLRLSLLEIFAQNFGFMAIDEGTRCLDKENKEIFFNMIKNLNNSHFQQVFIIDHDNTLSEVTNQTIHLNG